MYTCNDSYKKNSTDPYLPEYVIISMQTLSIWMSKDKTAITKQMSLVAIGASNSHHDTMVYE
jgi:hypothetical protein